MNISRREKRRISKSARDFASSVRIFVSREIVLIRTIYIYIYVYIRPSVRRNLSIVSKKRSRKFDRRENRRETSSDTIGLGVHRRVLCFSSGFSRSKIEKKRKKDHPKRLGSSKRLRPHTTSSNFYRWRFCGQSISISPVFLSCFLFFLLFSLVPRDTMTFFCARRHRIDPFSSYHEDKDIF